MDHLASQTQKRLDGLKVLVVDDERTMRQVTRSLLQAIGVKNIRDACDGLLGLEATCSWGPDIVVLDWKMPNVSGLDFVRRVRSPQDFPYPDVPIIMPTAFGERSRVMEAVELGVNEFLLKPVSTKALHGRLLSILMKPRRMVKKASATWRCINGLLTTQPRRTVKAGHLRELTVRILPSRKMPMI